MAVMNAVRHAFSSIFSLAIAYPYAAYATGLAVVVLVGYYTWSATTPGGYKTLQLKIKARLLFETPRKTPCSQCAPAVAETYCVECKRVYCKFCACLLHHPGMKTEKHSIEALIETEKGVQVLSHILPDILTFFILGVFYLFLERASEEQILGASYCPILQRTRVTLVRWDPSVFYYWKGHMAQFCDFEDSAWRLYIDAWYRAVVSRTDSLFLVLVAFVKAFLFEKYIELVLAKIMGVLYGVLAIGVRYVETYIPSNFHFLDAIFKGISLAKFVKIAGKPPPPTFWRRRPMQNYVEGWKYALDRRARLFSYYQGHAQGILVALLKFLLYGAVLVRLACIILGADYYLRVIFNLVGFGDIIKHDQKMFLGITGFGVEQENHPQYYSEWLCTIGFWHIMSHRWTAMNTAVEVGGSLFEGLRAAMWPMIRMMLIPGLVALAMRTYYTRTINKQNLYFARNWMSVREDIFGSASRDNLVDWKNARFRRDNADS